MSYADTLLPEFDQEMKTTRTMLERVPYGAESTKPNVKSRTMHELASHLANVARFGDLIVNNSERDFAVPGSMPPAVYDSRDELLKVFDTNVAASRKAIQSIDEGTLGETWTIRNGSHVLIALPRAAALRALLVSHTIHHRGQLSAYFRLNDVPHPSIYGPTAEMSGL